MARDQRRLAAIVSIDVAGYSRLMGADDSGAPPDFRRLWTREHAQLAARSTDAIHLIAFDSGHVIQEDAPELVIAAIDEVLATVRDGQPLAPCDDRFADVGGECAP